MSYRFEKRFDPMSGRSGASVVKVLIIANVAFYVIKLILHLIGPQLELFFVTVFGLVPQLITTKFFVWQFLTAMFLHGDFWHILFNMLGLYFFGPELELIWGKKRFLKVYLGIGILSFLFAYLINIYSPIPTIGASGAVYGILGAYAALYPDRQIILYIFPVKVKYFVLIVFITSFLGLTGLEGGGGVSYAAHFAGILLGVGFVKVKWTALQNFRYDLSERLRLWRLRRKYRNFKIVDSEVKEMWDDLEDKINDDKKNSHIN
jgi:membrane associated rhomboid family serine protease